MQHKIRSSRELRKGPDTLAKSPLAQWALDTWQDECKRNQAKSNTPVEDTPKSYLRRIFRPDQKYPKGSPLWYRSETGENIRVTVVNFDKTLNKYLCAHIDQESIMFCALEVFLQPREAYQDQPSVAWEEWINACT